MTYTNEYRLGRRAYHYNREESAAFVLSVFAIIVLAAGYYILTTRFHVRPVQLIELSLYAIDAFVAAVSLTWYFLTIRRRREENWPHPPLFMSHTKDRQAVAAAYKQNSIVLGYNVRRKPWFWSDATRVMQSVVFGATGSGKTTLLKNIITQDLFRVVGPPDDPHRIPMLIFDGKGDKEFLSDLLPAIETAGRMHQLRVLDPSRPQISARYNPFFSEHGLYQEHTNFVFESFDLKEDFFHGHQATYLSDLVRVLAHTGKRFNIYDVLVLALDQKVLSEQIAVARSCLEAEVGTDHQRRLNFEMSVRNLRQSFADRERVPKIQGLLNELMTFLEDDLSLITGAYDDLLSLDEVIDKELILFVSLNTNKNSKAVTALGRMLLQNMQLIIGKRYENERERRRENRPMVSVILDEFAPFAYSNFSQILQTARGTKTAFLFALQSLPQLLKVGRGFKDDVSSAPNTTMLLHTRDEETTQYFLNASARVRQKRRTLTVERTSVFDEKYQPIGFGSETDIKETRAQDEHIKNLPVGQMEILMTDQRQGTLHSHLHVCACRGITAFRDLSHESIHGFTRLRILTGPICGSKIVILHCGTTSFLCALDG
jgi:Type IV secretory system Conjugative DNA transfer